MATHVQGQWLDCVQPTKKELVALAETNGFPAHLVKDCLDPTHLPKLETHGDSQFLMVRSYDETATPDSATDTVHELTRKIAFFWKPGSLLSIHRKDQKFIRDLRTEGTAHTAGLALTALLEQAILSYESPILRAVESFEDLETQVFSGSVPADVLERLYSLKRRAGVFKRMLKMNADAISKLRVPSEETLPLNHLRGECDRLAFYAEDLSESLNHLLNLHLALASQRTNEIVRLLTVFSMFFLPLNLIAGIYGMNFVHMPELQWRHGYYGALGLMIAVAITIGLWFRRKGWMRG